MLDILISDITFLNTVTLILFPLLLFISYHSLQNLLILNHIPSPPLYALTKWRLAFSDYSGTRTRTIHALHTKYSPIIRIGPREISFSRLSALRTIYGAGSGFERTSFYRMFDVYGTQNLFTFASVAAHSQRKKLLTYPYSKSVILKEGAARAVEMKVWEFMRLLEREPEVGREIFRSLHYYALDSITEFLYGEFGRTKALGEKGDSDRDRRMISDILDPKRRKLAWFACHLPRYTGFLMSRTGITEKVVEALGLLPQTKPTVYTGIRKHALEAWGAFKAAPKVEKEDKGATNIIGRLWESHMSNKKRVEGGLSDLEIASEAADHLLAGVDTTSDTLMFLIWALSLPENSEYQEKLIEEVNAKLLASDLDSRGIPTAEATGKLEYLDAVLKETLRLYAPLPASEPRCLPTDCVIDGVRVPAGTVVSMSPYTLHRNPDVFLDPLLFNPERWLGDLEDVAEMKKWFWAFSSGGRMCIGIQ
ncbi:putative cytochrome P450 [Hyaloscypha hepaticicola]|uniref:Putative cytochrome P450 n=1 Tax=Hyaloscypha hepaticicola TaxID=2082293 RepID=A0A2J6Q109_9HELO|nr:putative cytochrome P450 [Hyaloscypha hepaticicola]